MNDLDSSETRSDPPMGAGARLRAAREGAGRSADDVAHALRLDARIIHALEAEDRAALPADTFVWGYLRAYARLLEVDADALVREFPHDDIAPALVPNISRPQVRSSDTPVRLFTYLIVLGLLGLLGAWWLTQGSSHFETFSDGGFGGEGGGDAGALVLPEAYNASDSYSDVRVPLMFEEAIDPEPAAVPAPASAPESRVASIPEPTSPEPATAQEEAVSVAEPAPSTPASPAPGLLVLRYSADSWTEVTDATGERLAYDLVGAGRELRLEGEPPFTVFLGYSPGVRLSYDGASFDQSRYNRANDAARFRVGRARTTTSGN